MRVLLLLLAILFFSAAAQGRAYCPRVTSEHNADTTDLKRFRNFHLWKDKTGNELAYAIWQYLCGYETGLYHFYEVHDGPDPYGEYSTMREPLKMLNVYNMGYCGIFGPTVEGIYHGVGFETGRSFFLAKWSHCATEISYDNDWRRFLSDAAASAETKLDQWELQMQSRVLERIGLERLWLVSDGIPAEMQRHIAVTPVLGAGDAKGRAQGAIDEFLSTRPDARLAVIPDGPYTMLRPE